MQKLQSGSLPEPEEHEQERSRQLRQRICAACQENGGLIRFDDYMNMVLYTPGLGYYSGGLQKFGKAGDFITAPEVSPLFGQCLGNQLAEISRQFAGKNTAPVCLLEFGAGSGRLAVDILQRLEQLDCLPQSYYILELSAELRQRQRRYFEEKAPQLLQRIVWLDSLAQANADSNMLVIANEVLDAMPQSVFRMTDGRVESLMIGCENTDDPDGRLFSAYQGAEVSVQDTVHAIEARSALRFAPGYQSEFNPAMQGWLQSLAQHFSHLVILLIDYGYNEQEYYHPERSEGTLMCYYRHQAHSDYLWWPGLQDLTAFVNFTDVAYSADAAGLSVSGYTTQAAFLLANGLSKLHENQVTDDLQQQIKLSQQIKTLTLPSEMGERFKVMALTKGYDAPLGGFSMLDLRNRL